MKLYKQGCIYKSELYTVWSDQVSKTCIFSIIQSMLWGFPGGSVIKNLPANTEDMSWIPGSGRYPGEGIGNPLQYFELPRWLNGKESTYRSCRRHRFHPWVRKIPWRQKWWPIPVFLPGKSHGQRSLAGYSPWGHKSQTGPSDFHFTSLPFKNYWNIFDK